MHDKNVIDILADVLEKDPSARNEYLRGLDLGGEMHSEVEALLLFEGTSDDFMSVTAGEISSDFFSFEEDSLVGQQVGVYKITKELGLGGMGAVYLAERCDGKFEQRVALKMLKRELNVKKLRHNFERERDILAKLEHQNIARLLDAGTTADGVPYLAMEYVEGEPINLFCEKNNLNLHERLKLFQKACDAVSFAHRNLIVHRDIKPSNIIVSSTGEPKLLDFGISKLLDGETKDMTVTMLGAMTPAYASPEQVRGEIVTTSTDIYSLGVVLYKMLTNSLPYHLNGRPDGDLFKAITEDEPTAPSAIPVFHDAGSRTGNRKLLKGDLDNIVLKSICKEPERRYRSVEQFTADIWRYIDGKPVEARPATRTYRLTKFYKRNKIAIMAAVLIFAALAVGLSAALRQTSIARANAAVAVLESDNAKAERKKAEKISGFMVKIFRYSNPSWYADGHKFGGETRIIDALDDMSPKVDTEFADEPDVLAELHHHFGDAYMKRNEPDGHEKAKAHFTRALKVRRSHLGDWHELVAKDMAHIYWTQKAPRSEESIKMLSDAIVMMRATNRKNLNLPYMLEEYYHKLLSDDFAGLHDMYLRHLPQPAPGNRYLAADQLFDEMLDLIRLQFAEESGQVVHQKCIGMALKWRINKRNEADEFYRTCEQFCGEVISSGKAANPEHLKRLAEFRRLIGREH